MIMSTRTLAAQAGGPVGVSERQAGPLQRFWAALMADQEARARRYVDGYLAQLGPAQLKELGYTAGEIKSLRRQYNTGPCYWV